MATDPHDTYTIDALADHQPRCRGRPRKPDALTPAERMRRYRARKKAGLVKDAKTQRIEALEAENAQLRDQIESLNRFILELDSIEVENAKLRQRIKDLEVENARLRDELVAVEAECVPEPKSVTSDEKSEAPEIIDLTPHAAGRCQAATKRGGRCRRSAKTVIVAVDSLGRRYEICACSLHQAEDRCLIAGQHLKVAKASLEPLKS
ncbi:hypothetical protein MIN45_P1886 [Methylomarinovum tepidoasis]|uniref:BZIP domain-containing protein n=1 Tax=Methylomarinovum tepidoasis TaxID=2840183 RepID=A0AAU9CGX2_9GAMM|nr:hypothetical protein [Methylomarinovum sp. IN45]BCX89513.1 hypothetical protein MIN45_P1886 [Methylomarinovum sp. IN45]